MSRQGRTERSPGVGSPSFTTDQPTCEDKISVVFRYEEGITGSVGTYDCMLKIGIQSERTTHSRREQMTLRDKGDNVMKIVLDIRFST